MFRKFICAGALIGFFSLAYAEPGRDVIVVDIAGFRAEHIQRGRLAAEEDIRKGKPGFYVGVCSFPELSKANGQKLQRQKEYLIKIGIQPREYDNCSDLVEEAQRFAAFVEGYNAVSSIQISKRTGKAGLP